MTDYNTPNEILQYGNLRFLVGDVVLAKPTVHPDIPENTEGVITSINTYPTIPVINVLFSSRSYSIGCDPWQIINTIGHKNPND